MRTEVKSSLLRSVSYDRSTRVLTVEFKPREGETTGKVYEYKDVDLITYEKFINAPSIGRAFLKDIKPAHACTRVKEEPEHEQAAAEEDANRESAKTDAEAEAKQRDSDSDLPW